MNQINDKRANVRLTELFERFEHLKTVTDTLNSNSVYFLIGGSASLYLQGNLRKPNDVDLMFTRESHDEANRVFHINKQFIERPTVTMYKSTPVDDGSIDFLSEYDVVNGSQTYKSDAKDKVELVTGRGSFNLVPTEKIILFKLIGRHHHDKDLADVAAVLHDCSIDNRRFWELVDKQKVRQLVRKLVAENNLGSYLSD